MATLCSRRLNFHIDPITRPAALFAAAFGSKKWFGLSVLDYVVTSNHIHLLVKDIGAERQRACSCAYGAETSGESDTLTTQNTILWDAAT
jgi:hypothetical protein